MIPNIFLEYGTVISMPRKKSEHRPGKHPNSLEALRANPQGSSWNDADKIERWKGYIRDGLPGKHIAKKEGLAHGSVRVFLTKHKDKLGLQSGKRRPLNTKRDAEVEAARKNYKKGGGDREISMYKSMQTRSRSLYPKMSSDLNLTVSQIKHSLRKRKKLRDITEDWKQSSFTESIGDVHREIGRDLKRLNVNPESHFHKLGHAFMYQDYDEAAKHYRNMNTSDKQTADSLISNRSHYHGIGGLFHNHMAAMDAAKTKKPISLEKGKPGSKEHFLDLAAAIHHNLRVVLSKDFSPGLHESLMQIMDKHFGPQHKSSHPSWLHAREYVEKDISNSHGDLHRLGDIYHRYF